MTPKSNDTLLFLHVADKLYYSVQPDASIRFPSTLHFVAQFNLRGDVDGLNDRAFEQLSSLVVAPLKNQDVQVG